MNSLFYTMDRPQIKKRMDRPKRNNCIAAPCTSGYFGFYTINSDKQYRKPSETYNLGHTIKCELTEDDTTILVTNNSVNRNLGGHIKNL